MHTLEELWANDESTEYCVEVYTEGDCWGLAWYLHKITGAPLVLCGTRKNWQHVMVLVGCAQYLDVCGISSQKDAEAYCINPGQLTVLRAEECVNFGAYTRAIEQQFWMYDGEGEQAEMIAKLVVNKYLGGNP